MYTYYSARIHCGYYLDAVYDNATLGLNLMRNYMPTANLMGPEPHLMRRTYEYDRSGNSLSAYNVIIMSYTVVDICANPSVGLPSNLIVLVFA